MMHFSAWSSLFYLPLLWFRPISGTITVTNKEDIWAVGISGLQFMYRHDCTGDEAACAYGWSHEGFSESVTLVFTDADCSCSSCANDYTLTCDYLAPILISTLTIKKRLVTNNTQVAVTGSLVAGIAPVALPLDYCNQNDLQNLEGISLQPTQCDFDCVSKFSCIEGYVETTLNLTCLRNSSWSSTDLQCEKITCSGSSCSNCCELNTLILLSDVAPLSYNRSITAKCCEGFVPKNNVSMDDFMCNTTGSIDVNLDCTPVVCSGANCSNCCALNSSTLLSDVEPLSYNQSLKVECCEGFISENSTEMSEFTCNTIGSIDVDLTCKPVTTVATPINESFKRGVIAGISICIIYVVFCIVCIISIKVSWMRTIKPHSGIYVLLGITLILLAISAGLSFGLNDDTPNFTTGGIVGLVIGVITILLVIGCCVWICISIINFVPEKTPNGNSPPVGNIPRKNQVGIEMTNGNGSNVN